MFDIGAIEILVIVVVAILVIGPQQMPQALRHAGRWMGKIRRTSAQFRAGFDSIVREAELEEMEQKWQAQNAEIMAQGTQMEPLSGEGVGAETRVSGEVEGAATTEQMESADDSDSPDLFSDNSTKNPPSSQPSNSNSDQPSGQVSGQVSGQSSGQNIDQTVGQSSSQPSAKSSGQTAADNLSADQLASARAPTASSQRIED